MKSRITWFHVESCSWPQRNELISVMQVQSCCFAHKSNCFFNVFVVLAVVALTVTIPDEDMQWLTFHQRGFPLHHTKHHLWIKQTVNVKPRTRHLKTFLSFLAISLDGCTSQQTDVFSKLIATGIGTMITMVAALNNSLGGRGLITTGYVTLRLKVQHKINKVRTVWRTRPQALLIVISFGELKYSYLLSLSKTLSEFIAPKSQAPEKKIVHKKVV